MNWDKPGAEQEGSDIRGDKPVLQAHSSVVPEKQEYMMLFSRNSRCFIPIIDGRHGVRRLYLAAGNVNGEMCFPRVCKFPRKRFLRKAVFLLCWKFVKAGSRLRSVACFVVGYVHDFIRKYCTDLVGNFQAVVPASTRQVKQLDASERIGSLASQSTIFD